MAGPPTRRQLSAEQTRRRLLAVAMEEFSRRPYSEVTVGEIARGAGVAHGLLSHHFNGKPGLYAETLREISRQLQEVTRPDPAMSAGEQIRHRIRSYVGYMSENEDIARNLILGCVQAGPDAVEVFDAGRYIGLKITCDVLGLDFASPAVRVMMSSYVRAAETTIEAWLDANQPYSAELLAESIVEQLRGAVRGVHCLDPSVDEAGALAVLG